MHMQKHGFRNCEISLRNLIIVNGVCYPAGTKGLVVRTMPNRKFEILFLKPDVRIVLVAMSDINISTAQSHLSGAGTAIIRTLSQHIEDADVMAVLSSPDLPGSTHEWSDNRR